MTRPDDPTSLPAAAPTSPVRAPDTDTDDPVRAPNTAIDEPYRAPDTDIDEPAHEFGPPATSPPREPGAAGYVLVWLALVALATLTLIASRAVPGGWGLAIAFVVASAKAGLVVAFFMHLAGGRPIHRLVFAIAIAFLVLLVLGVLADVGTRSLASAYVDDLGGPP
ncbi:MAG TPA: cytochrome C oxidase subunit IV family protein [Kofleriaceae bacterium]|nr:cytochrome C oxidase subunit IV family protein [Kofleriaceae bacterium]